VSLTIKTGLYSITSIEILVLSDYSKRK